MMANGEKVKITMNQGIWLVVAMGPVGVITLPREIAQFAGQSGWITLCVSYLLVVLFSWIMLRLAVHYPGQNFIVIADMILGKWLGRIVSFALILLVVAAASVGVRLMADGVDTYLMVHTPLFAVVLAILLSVMYVINKGIGTVARFNEFLQPIIILIFALVISFTLGKTDFSNLLPIISEKYSVTKSLLPSLYPFSVIAAAPYLFSYFTQPKQLWKSMSWGLFIIFICFSLLFVFVIAIFGPVETTYIEYPSIDMARIIQFPLFERVDIVFAVFWIAIEYTVLMVLFYVSSFALQQYTVKGSFFLWSSMIMVIIFVLSLIPDDVEHTRRYAYILHSVSMGFLFVIYPLLVFIDYLKRKVSR